MVQCFGSFTDGTEIARTDGLGLGRLRHLYDTCVALVALIWHLFGTCMTAA